MYTTDWYKYAEAHRLGLLISVSIKFLIELQQGEVYSWYHYDFTEKGGHDMVVTRYYRDEFSKMMLTKSDAQVGRG